MTRLRSFRLLLVAGATTLGTGVLLPGTASGHADADVIAVAAGEEVTIKLALPLEAPQMSGPDLPAADGC